MEEMEPIFAQSVVNQQTVTIPKEHNTLIVHLREHTWVSVSTETEKIVSDRTTDPIVGFFIPPGNYIIKTDGKIEKVISEAVEQPPSLLEQLAKQPSTLLRLSSDAPDKHVVDGIGEVPADGTSFCTITVEKVGLDGTPLTGKEHKDEVFLRTTGGMLMDEKGKDRIRSLTLKSGQAKFRLVSEKYPRLVIVSVFGQGLFAPKAEIQIEFV